MYGYCLRTAWKITEGLVYEFLKSADVKHALNIADKTITYDSFLWGFLDREELEPVTR